MGGVSTNSCRLCCLYATEESKPLLPLTPDGPNQLTMFDLTIDPINSSSLSSQLDLCYLRLCNYLKEDFSHSYQPLYSISNCRIVYKEFKDILTIKSEYFTTIGSEEVFSHLDSVNRKNWDQSIEDIYELACNEDFRYMYILFKKKFLQYRKEVLLAKKIYRSDGVFEVCTSCENESMEKNEDVIRLNVKLMGFHGKTIARPDGMLTQIDLVVEAECADKEGKNTLLHWVQHILEGLDSYLKSL